MSDDLNDQQGRIWLDRGVAAARAGRRAEAREALFRALNYEAQREMAWLWLAAVADDRRQERMYLAKVLSLNPDNPHAQAGLVQLDKVLSEEQTPPEPKEPNPASESSDRQGTEKGGESKGVPDASPAEVKPLPPKRAEQSKPQPQKAPRSAGTPVEMPKPSGEVKKDVPPQQRPVTAAPDVKLKPATTSTDKPLPVALVPAEPVVKQAVEKGKQAQKGPGVDGEPSGWTTQAAPVKRPSPPPPGSEPTGWTRSEPKPSGAALSASRPPPRKAQAVPYAAERLSPPRSGFAGVVSEAFQSHETWTALLAIAGLVVLAIFLTTILILYSLS